MFVSSFHYLYFISNFLRLFDAERAAVQHLDLNDHYTPLTLLICLRRRVTVLANVKCVQTIL